MEYRVFRPWNDSAADRRPKSFGRRVDPVSVGRRRSRRRKAVAITVLAIGAGVAALQYSGAI